MNDLVKTNERPVIQADDVTPISMMFDAQIAERVKVIAQTMSAGKVSVPEHLRNNVGDCLAIVMQAASWRLNPFAVAQKTHLIHGRLGYEAQLVSAVVSSLGLLEGRFSYEYEGDWTRIETAPRIVKGQRGAYPEPGWKPEDETGLVIIVTGKLKGDAQPRHHRLAMVTVWPRNSTLWATAPQQQIAYLATKQWVRKFAPDAILGVYTPDEIQQEQAIRVVEPTGAGAQIMERARQIEQQEAAPPTNTESDTEDSWPRIDDDGHSVDARMVPYNEKFYSAGKTCNDDGSWRKRRGVSKAEIDDYEARYLVKTETGGAQEEQREVGRELDATGRPEDEMNERIKRAIIAAATGMTEDEMNERIKRATSATELDHLIAAVESHPAWDESVKADMVKLARDYRDEWLAVETAQKQN